MTTQRVSRPKIHSLIERFFIMAGLLILISTLAIGVYLNKYDEQQKQKNNLYKIHRMLSQLIVPSLIISDLSEVRRLLYMASGDNENFLVVDGDGTIIMADYEKIHFSKFVLNSYKTVNDCKNIETSYKNIGGKKYLIYCSILKNSDMLAAEKNVGVLLSFTNYEWLSFSPLIFYFVSILMGLFLILIILFRRMLYRQLLLPLITLKDRILHAISIAHELPSAHIDEIDNAPRELVEIKESFENLLLSLQGEYNRRIIAEKMKALIELSVGVAHDIRAPLIALDVLIKDNKNISEEERREIRYLISRGNDIANNILMQYKQRKIGDSTSVTIDVEPVLITDLLMSIISEKRVKHRNAAKRLLISLEENTYGKFSMVSASLFNRVLSNLIDNAIEANSDEIKVNLTTLNSEKKEWLQIQIKDNGCGIPTEILNKILNGETISSKEKGNGLGLLHAIKTIGKEWNGQFCIHSSVYTGNPGTTIEIKLPQVPVPKWFLSKLILRPKETIVILDDDESIHQVWKQRFDEIHADFNFCKYYRSQDLIIWHKTNKVTSSFFLIDYEIIGSAKNGLNVIEELNIKDRSCLVTSHYDDSTLRAYCEMNNLKIIPKTFASYIPIILNSTVNKEVDLIFIDDEDVIRNAWVLHGYAKGKTVAAYNSICAFNVDINKYDHNTPIFIDSNLNDVAKGQDFAKELHEKGFKNIYLSTGYLSTDFPKMYWIKEVVSKEPPF